MCLSHRAYRLKSRGPTPYSLTYGVVAADGVFPLSFRTLDRPYGVTQKSIKFAQYPFTFRYRPESLPRSVWTIPEGVPYVSLGKPTHQIQAKPLAVIQPLSSLPLLLW